MPLAAYILQGMLALVFLIAGSGKLAGSKMHVENFNRWRLPQWFRVFTGAVELAGAVLLVIGYWIEACALAGAAILALTGIGGVLVHVRIKDSFKDTVTILVMGILAIVTFVLHVL